MTHHLCISVTLLDPLFHGKGDGDEPEWPPSPMRLFQALLAGSHTGCRERDWSDTKAEAFRWLERRAPPQIVAPEARPAAAYTLFVPNNDGDKKFHRQDRLTSKVARPHRLLAGDEQAEPRQTLHYLWSIPKEQWPTSRPHAELLCLVARHLMALGWGIDHAVGHGRILTDAESAALPGQRWRPWRSHRPGQRVSRIPTRNSLDNLERVHESFLKRVNGRQFNPPLKLSQFDSAMYTSAVALPPRSYAAFELPDGVALRPGNANKVAAMLRSLACRCAKADSHEFPGGSDLFVAGHVGKSGGHTPPRFSYLPLPTIGHGHADGMIRRLLIAEPIGGDGSHARWAQQRLRNQVLRDKDRNECGILLGLWRQGSAAMVKRYVGASESWSTVTPVILPGFDDFRAIPPDETDPDKIRRPTKAERLFLTAVTHAGLPVEAVESFTLRKAPFWPGAQHPRQYHRPDYLKHLPGWHVWMRFREVIPGPIAIGAGRHCGLGVFAAVEASG